MLKAIIIDDEKNSRDTLSMLLQAKCDDVIEVVAQADSVTSGLEAIELYKPDIIFLDIQMNDETGFDLLTRIKKIDFGLVFTTAFDNYALQAIKFSAIDYLLKPIDGDELKIAVEKVKDQKDKDSFNERFVNFIDDIKSVGKERRRIAVSTADGLIFLTINDIVYCSAHGPYTCLRLKSGEEILSSKNLKDYDDLLTPQEFLRIHNSFLINLREVKQYITKDGGHVVMSDNTVVEISKRKKGIFLSVCKKNALP